jgi:DNA-binding PadR family transcriptional regulator
MSAQPRCLRDVQFRNRQLPPDISSTEQRGLRGATPGTAGPERSLEHPRSYEQALAPARTGEKAAPPTRVAARGALSRTAIYRLTVYHVSIYAPSVTSGDPDSYLPLPQAQFHVLVALTAGERHGYAIMQDVEASSNGLVQMGPATLYGTLKRLVDAGLAEELAHRRGSDDDQRRRYYRLTALGQRVCAAEANRLAGLVRITRANLRPGAA